MERIRCPVVYKRVQYPSCRCGRSPSPVPARGSPRQLRSWPSWPGTAVRQTRGFADGEHSQPLHLSRPEVRGRVRETLRPARRRLNVIPQDLLSSKQKPSSHYGKSQPRFDAIRDRMRCADLLVIVAAKRMTVCKWIQRKIQLESEPAARRVWAKQMCYMRELRCRATCGTEKRRLRRGDPNEVARAVRGPHRPRTRTRN